MLFFQVIMQEIYDKIMSYKKHVQSVVKSSFNQLRNIAKHDPEICISGNY